jgi:hypothetical protein
MEVSLPYVDAAPSNRLMSEALYLIAQEAEAAPSPPVPPTTLTVPSSLNGGSLGLGEATKTEVHLARLALREAMMKVGGDATLVDELQRSLDGQLRAARLTNYWLEKEIQKTNAHRKQSQLDAASSMANIEREEAALQSVCSKIEGELALKRKTEAFCLRHFGA